MWWASTLLPFSPSPLWLKPFSCSSNYQKLSSHKAFVPLRFKLLIHKQPVVMFCCLVRLFLCSWIFHERGRYYDSFTAFQTIKYTVLLFSRTIMAVNGQLAFLTFPPRFCSPSLITWKGDSSLVCLVHENSLAVNGGRVRFFRGKGRIPIVETKSTVLDRQL